MGDLVTTRDLSAPRDSLGRYRLLGVLAQGRRGTLHLALARGLGAFNKLVVVKELRAELARDAACVEAFLAEATLAARLNHSNVVQALEADRDVGRPFIALEFLDGQPFSEVLKRGRESGGLSLAVQVHVLCEVLAGLHYAHQLCGYDGREMHVVHRDVRPENVFITYEGQVKVLDFGAAQVDAPAFVPGERSERLAYAAPEQVRGRPSDARTDVFAAGVMLWEVLAGKAFADPSDPGAIRARLFGLEPRISQVAPGVPHGLANICNRAISVDPADRFGSAEDFRDALLAFLRASGESIDSRKAGAEVRALFPTERAAMQRIVESALELDDEPTVPASAPPEADASAPHPPAATVSSLPPFASAIHEEDELDDAPNFRSRRAPLIAALGATALAAAGGFWFGMSPRFAESGANAAGSPVPSATASVTSAASAEPGAAAPAPAPAPSSSEVAPSAPAPSVPLVRPRPRTPQAEEPQATPEPRPEAPAPVRVSPDNPYE